MDNDDAVMVVVERRREWSEMRARAEIAKDISQLNTCFSRRNATFSFDDSFRDMKIIDSLSLIISAAHTSSYIHKNTFTLRHFPTYFSRTQANKPLTSLQSTWRSSTTTRLGETSLLQNVLFFGRYASIPPSPRLRELPVEI